MQAFRFSFLISFIALVLASYWGYTRAGWTGAISALVTASMLAVIEISLSFDNAVVNAGVLKHWNAFWQKLFMTFGMLIAVFGMRLLFPLLIVAVVTNLNLIEVWNLAIQHPAEYARHLSDKHAEVAAFGGTFLLLVFLQFIFDEEKEMHWMPWIEEFLSEKGSYLLAVAITGLALTSSAYLLPEAGRMSVLIAGALGIGSYVGVDLLSKLLEAKEKDPALGKTLMRGSIGSFCYLEVLDASFSFDGVIGAFAISHDIVLIMLGLTIGAIFVRSMTIFLVENGTLDEFVYLEHGAHYAVGILALIMFASVRYHIPEWVTGLSGVAFISLSLWSSVLYRRRKTGK